MSLSRQAVHGAGVLAAALAAVALAVANFVSTEPGENGGGAAYAATLGISLLLAAAVFGWAIPRTERPGQVGLAVGALGLLSVAAFWSGLPYVLGPAAIVLGLLGRARPGQQTPATIAVVLGALTTAAAVAAVIIDQMA